MKTNDLIDCSIRMQITVNGKAEEIPETSVLGLLQLKNIEPQMVSVELNTTLLPKDRFLHTFLKEGDRIEFLYFMGGGSGSPLCARHAPPF